MPTPNSGKFDDNRCMKTNLIPRSSRLVPTRETKEFHLRRIKNFPPEKFETYNDWFYFIHVDPFTRWVHAIGMVIGLILYFIAGYKFLILGLKMEVVFTFLSGALFFFYIPMASHYFYDGGTANSTADKYHSTFLPVVHINLLTLTGRYDAWLRTFIKKYPFTVEAWELEDRIL